MKNMYVNFETTFDYINAICNDEKRAHYISELVRTSPYCQADVICDCHGLHNRLVEMLKSILKSICPEDGCYYYYKYNDICPDNGMDINIFANRSRFADYDVFISSAIVDIKNRIDKCDTRAQRLCNAWYAEHEGDKYDYRHEVKKDLLSAFKAAAKKNHCCSIDELRKALPLQKALDARNITGGCVGSYDDNTFQAIHRVKENWELARKVVEKDYNRSFEAMLKYYDWEHIDVMIRQQMVREVYNETLEEFPARLFGQEF